MSENNFNLDELDSSLIQEVVEINTDANPMDAPPPPDDGKYQARLKLKPDSFEPGTTKNGVDFIKAQFTAQIIAEGTRNNNKLLFGRENTLVFDGKNKMAYIVLQALGGKSNPEAKAHVDSLKNYVAIAKSFKAVLSQEPTVGISTQWQASYNSTRGGKSEPGDKYKTVRTGQRNFPQNPDGTFNPVIFVSGTREDGSEVGEVRAQAVITDYFPAGV